MARRDLPAIELHAPRELAELFVRPSERHHVREPKNQIIPSERGGMILDEQCVLVHVSRMKVGLAVRVEARSDVDVTRS